MIPHTFAVVAVVAVVNYKSMGLPRHIEHIFLIFIRQPKLS